MTGHAVLCLIPFASSVWLFSLSFWRTIILWCIFCDFVLYFDHRILTNQFSIPIMLWHQPEVFKGRKAHFVMSDRDGNLNWFVLLKGLDVVLQHIETYSLQFLFWISFFWWIGDSCESRNVPDWIIIKIMYILQEQDTKLTNFSRNDPYNYTDNGLATLIILIKIKWLKMLSSNNLKNYVQWLSLMNPVTVI